MLAVARAVQLAGKRGIDQPAGHRCRVQRRLDKSRHDRADRNGLARISVHPRKLAVWLKARELIVPGQQTALDPDRSLARSARRTRARHEHLTPPPEAREPLDRLDSRELHSRRARERTPQLLPRAHEELVVTAVVLPELEEPDELPEVEEPDAEEPDFEPEPDDLPAVEATFAAAAFARAGSLPVTSCAKIPPELARNVAVTIATTRVRITLIRRFRVRSRSATERFAPDLPADARWRSTGHRNRSGIA